MIIGITGTNGAGKGTVVEYLEEKGFKHYSARAFIVEEIERRGLTVNRDSMNAMGNELRAQHTPSYVIEQLFMRAQAEGGNAVLESVRAVSEAEFLKSHGARLFFVDADPQVRYERARKRGSATDQVDFKTFMYEEERELRSDDPTKHSVLGVAERADYRLTNDGTLEDLHAQIEQVLAKIGE
ncbi:MAG TPA: AAA family ATPase [Candidatus Paceibacterota bacterium]|jgi:dephospho-CoA kinase